MLNQKYTLRYLPLFYEELDSSVKYIAFKINNIDAANNLLDSVNNAIVERRFVHTLQNRDNI